MKRKKQTTRQLLESMHELCGIVNEDDGIDPYTYCRKKRNRKTNHKTWQLCKQVAGVIHLCLNDCDDPIVQNMQLVNVRPNPDSSCLLLVIGLDLVVIDLQESLTALNNQLTRLRFEISRSIHRKRVPNLAFSILPTESANGM